MANFSKAYKKLKLIEGGYSNDPHDPGGETYKGISRRYHPHWIGWIIIDYFKKNSPESFITIINNHLAINTATENFYKEKYWDCYYLDDLKSQIVAEELFESSVNIGKKPVIKFLQKSLNLLNRDQTLYEDISEDGIFGNNTKRMLYECIKNKDEKNLFNLLNIFQGYRYIEIANERYIRGWLKRIKLKKK